MYKCPLCPKSYKTRTSLTRHSHNHSNTSQPSQQHACGTCGVVFARRDILNRHVNNGHCGGRHRVHTACEGCRSARVKCDGSSPCGSCVEAKRPCIFSAARGKGRVSWVGRRIEREDESDSGEEAESSPEQTDSKTMTAIPDGPGDVRAHLPTTPSSMGGLVSPKGEEGASSPKNEAVGDVHNTPWPWLHERNYMGQAKPSRKTRSPQSQQHTPSSMHRTNDGQAEPCNSFDEHDSETITPLVNVIENLVAYAAGTAFAPDDRSTRRRYWESVSLQLADIFRASGDDSVRDAHRTLYELVEIFLSRFNVLWPLLNHEQLDPDTHHPVLFLSATSIGAMFGQKIHRRYGELMHKRLRRLLSASLYDLEGPEDEMVWLAQARQLKQVASLYFGQNQGFSYAQHLAAITVAQLRRMDFFREPIPNESNRSLTPQQEGSVWQKDEGRRRIAFGMLRTDVYTSVLLSTRPLVTPEEVKLTFPRSDALWMNSEHLTAEGRLSRQREEDSQSLQMPFSDIVRIFLDRNEPKPELSPVGYELVLFGLQEAVWRFSHDAELFPRLTGACLGDTLFPTTTDPSLDHKPPIITSNAQSHRRMLDLHNDHARLIAALDSWSSAVNTALASGAYTAHRDTLMSSLLLYRLSMLRLAAPLEDLHHISYRAASPPTVSQRILSKTTAWTRSRFCPEAAQQAWDVKTLIEQELLRPQAEQARFNFLAFCSLHHAAVVLWTVAAMRDLLPKSTAKVPEDRDLQSFLNECPRLFSLLSPLGGNSFEASAYRLQACRFPRAAE